MTSGARIAANRKNASLSTGPRTPAGKNDARRNALRHGLACLTLQDPEVRAAIDRLATELAVGAAGRIGPDRARELAAARVQMRRVRAAEMPFWETISCAIAGALDDGAGSADGNITDGSDLAAEVNGALAGLACLSRYERRAASRWAKLLKGLD
jgi:hypothetical protein